MDSRIPPTFVSPFYVGERGKVGGHGGGGGGGGAVRRWGGSGDRHLGIFQEWSHEKCASQTPFSAMSRLTF